MLDNAPAPDYAKIFREADSHQRRALERESAAPSLDEAWDGIEGLPASWKPDFVARGRRFRAIKAQWRARCLKYHPDKHPERLSAAARAEWSAKFVRVQQCWVALLRHYRLVKPDDDEDDDDCDGGEGDGGADLGLGGHVGIGELGQKTGTGLRPEVIQMMGLDVNFR